METELRELKYTADLSDHEVNEESSKLERFYLEDDTLVRILSVPNVSHRQSINMEGRQAYYDRGDLRKLWWMSRMRGRKPVSLDPRSKDSMTIVDMFCGGGGLTTGIEWACDGFGFRTRVLVASDIFEAALSVYRRNHKPKCILPENVANLVDYSGDGEKLIDIVLVEKSLESIVGEVDFFIAGPPCEGNSNLNNISRRSDNRNELYVSAVAIAIALESRVVIIENVPEVSSAEQKVIKRSRRTLELAGYSLLHDDLNLDASRYGTAQTRRRHFTIGIKGRPICSRDILEELLCKSVSTMEAIGDLLEIEPTGDFDRPSELSAENRKRIDYLFDHGIYQLPASERPECHDEDNTYPSNYGRMYPDLPSQTLSTGFLSPGRGRYIHPVARRCLTPHEGARIQGFPDDYLFEFANGEEIARTHMARLIGDAVPPQLAYLVGLLGMRSLLS